MIVRIDSHKTLPISTNRTCQSAAMNTPQILPHCRGYPILGAVWMSTKNSGWSVALAFPQVWAIHGTSGHCEAPQDDHFDAQGLGNTWKHPCWQRSNDSLIPVRSRAAGTTTMPLDSTGRTDKKLRQQGSSWAKNRYNPPGKHGDGPGRPRMAFFQSVAQGSSKSKYGVQVNPVLLLMKQLYK